METAVVATMQWNIVMTAVPKINRLSSSFSSGGSQLLWYKVASSFPFVDSVWVTSSIWGNIVGPGTPPVENLCFGVIIDEKNKTNGSVLNQIQEERRSWNCVCVSRRLLMKEWDILIDHLDQSLVLPLVRSVWFLSSINVFKHCLWNFIFVPFSVSGRVKAGKRNSSISRWTCLPIMFAPLFCLTTFMTFIQQ